MLPYSPLHHVLLADAGTTLVMTSGNVSDEPIAYRDEDACERLADIADLFLLHDRPIETRTDDSVVRIARRRPLFLRRSRGYVPNCDSPAGGLRPAPARLRRRAQEHVRAREGGHAWVGHHVGDLKNYETLRSFTTGIDHFQRLFAVEPEVVAHDLHPEYLSTKYALELEGVRLIGVQHHHAHLAACLAEHGGTGPAVGAIFDGTGYGDDGTVWGGELLFGGLERVERVGFLFPVRMPGGEAAVRQPWRMACAWLAAAFDESAAAAGDPARDRRERGLDAGGRARAQRESPRRSPRAPAGSSTRSPRSAASGPRSTTKGRPRWSSRRPWTSPRRAPIRSRPATTTAGRSSWTPVAPSGRSWPTSSAAWRSRRSRPASTTGWQRPPPRPARPQPGAAVPTRSSSPAACSRTGACSAGTAALLRDAGLRVLTPERLPPNDGGIAYGQLAVAAARLAAEEERLDVRA